MPATVYGGTAGPQYSFAPTGQCVGERFFTYWQAHGGLPINGYPIGEVVTETLDDGRAYRVQYLERARFERHPDNPPPYDVEPGQFGRRILGNR